MYLIPKLRLGQYTLHIKLVPHTKIQLVLMSTELNIICSRTVARIEHWHWQPYFNYSSLTANSVTWMETHGVFPALESRWSHILIAERGLSITKVGKWNDDGCNLETIIEQLHCCNEELIKIWFRSVIMGIIALISSPSRHSIFNQADYLNLYSSRWWSTYILLPWPCPMAGWRRDESSDSSLSRGQRRL